MSARGYSVNLIHLVVVVAVALPVTQVSATTRITPLLGLNHTFIDADSLDGLGSGAVSVISPGLDYSMDSRQTSIDMLLLVDAEYYTGLDRDDRVLPKLDFGAAFDHEPGRWTSTLVADIRQVNDSVDGIRSLSEEVFNPFTRELRTFAADSNYINRLSSNVDYQAFARIDRTYLEDDDPTNGANLDLSINNSRSGNAFTWIGAVATDLTNKQGDRTRIDALALTLNYRIDSRWQAFTDLTSWRTNEDRSELIIDQKQDSFLFGLWWASRQNNFVRAGIGEFDGEASYSLNAQLTRRRTRLAASYTDGVTSARTDTLNRGGSATGTLDSQSLTSDPVVQKRADIDFSLQGRRSEFSFNLFDYSREPLTPGLTEFGKGVAAAFTRTLPRSASIGIDIRAQSTELTVTNDLSEFNTYYQKQLGKSVDAKVNLNFSKQESSEEANEYEQAQLGFSLFMRF